MRRQNATCGSPPLLSYSGGELVYFARMDGASPLKARMAVNKAYTAAKWRQNTKAIKDRLFDMGLGERDGASAARATGVELRQR